MDNKVEHFEVVRIIAYAPPRPRIQCSKQLDAFRGFDFFVPQEPLSKHRVNIVLGGAGAPLKPQAFDFIVHLRKAPGRRLVWNNLGPLATPDTSCLPFAVL